MCVCVWEERGLTANMEKKKNLMLGKIEDKIRG